MRKSDRDQSILFHGEIISKSIAESHAFPIGQKFHYKNSSYNDDFTVVAIKKDPGAEYRQIVGKIAGEVWILLSSLQKEAALGAVTFPEKIAQKEKAAKKTNTKKAKGKK
jgi:hypothetical protein